MRCFSRHPRTSLHWPHCTPKSDSELLQILLFVMLWQPSSAAMQWLPLQPMERVPTTIRAFLHISGSRMRRSDEPRVRQVWPPQPTQRMPSFSLELSQISRSVMSWQVDSEERQLIPPQPMDGMPRAWWDLAQMSSSVMNFAGEPGSKQESPPQPAHVPLNSAHISRELRSEHFKDLGMQRLPSHPADGMLSQAMELSQIAWSVIKVADASGERHRLPPQPAHLRPSLSLASSQRWGQVMSPHWDSSVRHLLPPQPMDLMPSSVWDFAQIAASVMRKAGAPRGRQTLPPQPAQETPRSMRESSQTSLLVISRQLSACTKKVSFATVAGLRSAFCVRKAAASPADARRQAAFEAGIVERVPRG
mmetsp:Transcript_44049/g.137143  ORF Transcript_44049/g.137143 Transcript_44049/m.137143 type:complete len:362 (+) Transcript_44049:115-1200(+)